jgi:cytochrome c peroxidase
MLDRPVRVADTAPIADTAAMISQRRAARVALALAALLACAQPPPAVERAPAAENAYRWRLPTGFPEPPVPSDNPMSEVKVALGRRLFYDSRLSGPRTMACATCHRQARAFTDGRARPSGVTGELHPRSAMSLANVAYNVRFGWADPELVALEQQVLVPLLGTAPVEMGAAAREGEVLARLEDDAAYRELFAQAFPGDASPIRLENVARAIAAFERTLLSGDSPYDRLFFLDDRNALSDAAYRGMRLFFSKRLRCSECHGGVLLAGPAARAGAPPPSPLYHNTALHDVDGKGGYPPPNEGLLKRTGEPADMGRFRAPSLRNIALTAPYMHDGSIATLPEVIEHYAAGGRASGSPRKSDRLTGFSISEEETGDVVAFLEHLTDRTFVTRPDLADPFDTPSPSPRDPRTTGASPASHRASGAP